MVELIIAALVLANPVSRWLGLAGGVLAFLTPFVTLSFLITTPEVWVMPLGDAHYGFPYLSGAGRLVLKDTLMLAGAVMIMADSAQPVTFTATVATLLPSLCRDSSGGACAIRQCVDE